MKTQAKTSLLFLIPFTILILLFSGFVYFSVSNYIHEDFYKQLKNRANTFAKVQTEKDTTQINNEEMLQKLPHEQDFIFPIKGNLNFIDEAKLIGIPEKFFVEVKKKGVAKIEKDDIFYIGIKYTTDKEEYIVVAAADNYFKLHHAVYLKRVLIFAILFSIVFSLIASLYFSKYLFKPLKVITSKVNQISSESLHLRLNIENKNDELNELVNTFNQMLNRIETSFETQNNFISNASHELRTPLTAIIGEADVALNKPRSQEEYVNTLTIILSEAEKLDNKTKALLFLAQTGFDGKNQKLEKVRIDQLIWDVKDTIEKINPKSKINVDMSLLPENPMMLKVKGNSQLLMLAISNIVSNACKYSNCSPVSISIGSTETHIIVVIRDQGIGIPINELKNIYDPFFRASNTQNFEGYGIGLPLAQNIIKMHNGELVVSSILNQGTTVQIKLPIGKFN